VAALNGNNPPWGEWNRFVERVACKAFTELRKKVNQLIAPLALDQIEFEVIAFDSKEKKED